MARRGLSHNLPNYVKGGCTVGACTYQSQAARTFHDDDDDDSGGVGRDSTVLTTDTTTGERAEEVRVQSNALKDANLSPVATPAPHLSRDCTISAREVEEASRILFAPEGATSHFHHHRAEAAYQDSEANKLQKRVSGAAKTSERAPQVEAGIDEAVEDKQRVNLAKGMAPTQSLPPMLRTRSPVSRSLAPLPSTLLARLHPQPEVHAEILRFGEALASNPRIQNAIVEELDMHYPPSRKAFEREGTGENDEGAAERSLAQMESAVRRLLGRTSAEDRAEAATQEGEEGNEERRGFGSAGGGYSGRSSFLTDSFEVLGAMSAEWSSASSKNGGAEEKVGNEREDMAENLPSNSFVSVGRYMRRKDSLAGEVSDEVLDELLRSEDDDDVIAQKLFAETPDDQVRRFLRNLDLECVICHEYMVEAAAVDCGEGHTFCGECIERWLELPVAGGSRCPTCQKPVHSTIPMRQYDAMIEKYVRASNLWDEQCSFYRRRTLAHMRREMERQDREEEETATAATQGPFAGIGNLFGLGTRANARRQRRRSRRATAAATRAAAGASRTTGDGGAGEAAQPWWKSELLSTALSVATMLVLLVLFKRGFKTR
ncbi:e3 ubiquitin-protein ligase rnf8 [Nannochloropsis gaditana]|uniref:E3 ubiquitin-protein ligase rnf8 n=1 Tax=Nannochloropsis gaditana TaxID=72520 RepID=W7TKZ0_9STRA|nr:e3 ubiquitin-protein ligase rnf8 [Nannochloropsis gaditana]